LLEAKRELGVVGHHLRPGRAQEIVVQIATWLANGRSLSC
jgi:hypothetical protein